MKNLYKGILGFGLIFLYCNSFAQTPPVREPDYNRPALFQSLPDRIGININTLQPLFEANVGEQVSIPLSQNFTFSGIISSIANKYNQTINSVVIRSSNFPGATFTFSKIISETGEKKFVGRIISFQHGDAYEMVLDHGQYALIKKGFYDLVNE